VGLVLAVSMLRTNSLAQLHQAASNSNAFGSIGIAAYEQGDFQGARYWLEAAVYDARIIDAGGAAGPLGGALSGAYALLRRWRGAR
jgi:hypothetical protein